MEQSGASVVVPPEHGYNVLNLTDPMDDDTSYGGHARTSAGIVGVVANNATGVAGVN
jgi:hypothetical protein